MMTCFKGRTATCCVAKCIGKRRLKLAKTQNAFSPFCAVLFVLLPRSAEQLSRRWDWDWLGGSVFLLPISMNSLRKDFEGCHVIQWCRVKILRGRMCKLGSRLALGTGHYDKRWFYQSWIFLKTRFWKQQQWRKSTFYVHFSSDSVVGQIPDKPD